jgi:rhomboid protease GluP
VTQSTGPSQPENEAARRTLEKPRLQSYIKRFPGTFGLIGVTSLIYLAQMLSTWLVGVDLVLYIGAKINEAIFAGEIWRFITPIFVHAGIWHIFVNMYSLYALGPAVERFFNTQRMLVIYFFSGISGVIFSVSFTPSHSVGASGAIFGLLGSLGTFFFYHRKSLGPAGQTYLRQIALVALLNLALGLAPTIDNWGHLGGLVAGSFLAWYIGPQYEVMRLSSEEPPRLVDRRPWEELRSRIFVIAIAVVLLAYLATLSPFSR